MKAFLIPILQLLALLADSWGEYKRKRRDQQRKDDHDQIDNDTDGALADRNWLHLPDSARREDGAPADYDVSGPSGTLNRDD